MNDPRVGCTERSFPCRSLVVLYAMLCLLFVATMRDTPGPACPSNQPCAILRRSAALAPPAPAPRGEGRLLLTVRDAAGTPVMGARITALLIVHDVAYLAGAATGDTVGHASVGSLSSGEFFVLVEAEGRSRASTRFVLGEAETRDLTVVLHPAKVVSVLVANDHDEPIDHAWVQVDAGDPLPFAAETDREGRASVGRLGPPPYQVHVGAKGHESASEWLTRPEIDSVRFALRPLGSMDVVVVDEQGAPGRGAEVAIVGSGLWPARVARTDSLGRAHIADLRAGLYNVRACAAELVTERESLVDLERGQTRSVTLVLVSGRHVPVLVAEAAGPGEQGHPVAGAGVVLTEGGLSPFPLEGTTDRSGRVLLGPIPMRGPAFLAVRADGFVPKNGVNVPESNTGEVLVALARAGSLRGDVVDARGFPVSGASIEVVGTGPGGEPIDETPERMAFRAAHFAWALSGPRILQGTGALGVTSGPIPPIPRGDPALAASALRFASTPPYPSLPASSRRGGDLVRSIAPQEPWVTRSDGTFRAYPVPPGRIRAIVHHPAYVETSSSLVTLAPAGQASVHVVLTAGGRLEGRVLDDRRIPISRARVEMAAVRGSIERATTCADDGTFAFASVPAEVALSVTRPDALDQVALRAIVNIRDGEAKSIELVLPAEREPMTIHVVDDRGEPLSSVQVVVASLSPEAPLRRTLLTSRGGEAIFQNMVGLPVRVQASQRGLAPLTRELSEAPRELSLELAVGAGVRGRVTTRRGHDSVVGAEVVLRTVSGPLETRTDRDGAYRFDNVPAGQAELRVAAAGLVTEEREIAIESNARWGQPIDLPPIDLVEGGTIEGRVVDARGDPVVGAQVSRSPLSSPHPSRDRHSSVHSGSAITDKAGGFRLVDVPEGSATLEAFEPGKGLGRASVDVVPGRTTDRVEIVLEEQGVPEGVDLSEVGVAITIAERRGGVFVQEVERGSEAERAGIEVGDRLHGIDDEPVRTASGAASRLQGPTGDDVILTLARGRDTRKVRLARERGRP